MSTIHIPLCFNPIAARAPQCLRRSTCFSSALHPRLNEVGYSTGDCQITYVSSEYHSCCRWHSISASFHWWFQKGGIRLVILRRVSFLGRQFPKFAFRTALRRSDVSVQDRSDNLPGPEGCYGLVLLVPYFCNTGWASGRYAWIWIRDTRFIRPLLSPDWATYRWKWFRFTQFYWERNSFLKEA